MTQTSIQHHYNSYSTKETNDKYGIDCVVYIPDTSYIVSAGLDSILKKWLCQNKKLSQFPQDFIYDSWGYSVYSVAVISDS